MHSVQRYLKRMGFCRGNKTGSVMISEAHFTKLSYYVRRLSHNISLPLEHRKQEVYIDESYIHHHYRRDETSLYHPGDSRRNQSKQPHKGRRYCFVYAIHNGNNSSAPRIVPHSEWHFCPKNSRGDYHKNFNAWNFEHWFKTQLLPNLNTPPIIVLDNARYHKSKQASTPKPHKMRKKDTFEKLNEYGISHDSNCTRPELANVLRILIDEHLRLEIEQLAHESGHEILWSPPCFSDLNPIDFLWAFMKKRIAVQYSKDTSLADVEQRLKTEFRHLYTDSGSKFIGNIIRHAERMFAAHLQTVEEEDIFERVALLCFDEASTCSDSERTITDASLGDELVGTLS